MAMVVMMVMPVMVYTEKPEAEKPAMMPRTDRHDHFVLFPVAAIHTDLDFPSDRHPAANLVSALTLFKDRNLHGVLAIDEHSFEAADSGTTVIAEQAGESC